MTPTHTPSFPTRLSWAVRVLLWFTFSLGSCNHLVDVPAPINTLTTESVFNTDAQAQSALAGLYTDMINPTAGFNFSNAMTTILGGLSADELVGLLGPGDPYYLFSTHTLLANDGLVSSSLWEPAYNCIYRANAILEGIAASTSGALRATTRQQLTGEAKFVRAFCYFYLTNFFGEVPLVLTIDFNKTSQLARSPQAQVYEQIIADLKDAQQALAPEYAASSGQRIRPNRAAATALLARVYLYSGQWAQAEAQATAVIEQASLYSLLPDLNSVFLTNSREAIWQLAQNTSSPYGTAILEGVITLPNPLATGSVARVLSGELIGAFEPDDQRRVAWVGSTTNEAVKPRFNFGTTYYAFKYKTGTYDMQAGGTPTEYYMVLRLAEQYLIRAEARAQQSNTGGAAEDINALRLRAGLPPTTAVTEEQLLAAVAHERQVELFAEWGHRWLDLKRTGQALALLTKLPLKGQLTTTQLLFPIPQAEIIVNRNLTQNPGY